MKLEFFPKQALKVRLTLLTMIVFVAGLWLQAIFISQVLRVDMERQLGEEAFSTTVYLATTVNEQLENRKRILEAIAEMMGPTTSGHATAMQEFLAQRPVLISLFNGGVFATGIDGTAVADMPESAGRLGTNYMDRPTVSIPLKEGKSLIGRPVMGKKLKKPIFSISAPLRNKSGRVIGALVGTINLGLPNFLDKIAEGTYGTTGEYFLLAPQHKLIVTATDKDRGMQPLPPIGDIPLFDRYLQGQEGHGLSRNLRGEEVLSAAKAVPIAGWIMVTALPTATAFAPIGSMLRHTFLTTILLTVIAGGLVWWFVAVAMRRQIAPILSSTSALLALSEQGVSAPCTPVGTMDEVGQLIESLNRVLHVLAEREADVKEQAAFKDTIMNSLAAEIAVVNTAGTILAVNQRWRDFVRSNVSQPSKPIPAIDVGANYLATCQLRHGIDTEIATQAFSGIQSVLAGRLPCFSLEYPCHSQSQQYWFAMTVTPLGATIHAGAVISHVDITDRYLAQQERDAAHLALRRLSDHQQDTLEAERRTLALDLHDQLGSNLTGIRLRLENLAACFPADAAESLREDVRKIVELASSIQQSTREICTRLRPSALDDLGLVEAARWLLRDWSENTGIAASGDFVDLQSTPAATLSIDVFRSLQELLTNVARHAGATCVQVELTAQEQMLHLRVSDDGHGFAAADQTSGFGLAGVRERAYRHDGTVVIKSGSSGTTITVSFAGWEH